MRALIVVLAGAAAWLAVPRGRDRRVGEVVASHAPSLWLPRIRERIVAAGRRVGIGPASRRRHARARSRAIQAIGALAAELEAGQPPTVAVVRACGEPPVWPHSAGAARSGADVASALELDAATHPVLMQVAACWRAAADSGAGLAASISRVAESARAAEDVRVDLEGQLAGPRSTARLLAVLPVVGIGFGLMLGADPLAWLVGSTPGRACLACGVALTGTGVWWTGRIAASVERLL